MRSFGNVEAVGNGEKVIGWQWGEVQRTRERMWIVLVHQ